MLHLLNLMLFFANELFQRGSGGVCYACGKSIGVGGGGGLPLPLKKWKIQGGGGVQDKKIPSVVGVWICSGTTQFSHIPQFHNFVVLLHHTLPLYTT